MATITAPTAPKLQPTSPGEDEQRLLTERSIDFERKEVAFGEIDLDASKHNQARFLPLHEDTVITYGAAMEQGDVFPPIILTGGKGRYLVLDGNHRVAAAMLAGYGRTTAFICTKLSKAQAELLTFEANARHGLPTSVDERIQQGMYLVNLGNQPKAVARALAIPENKLWRALNQAKTTERLAKLGLDPKQFGPAYLHRMGSLRSNVVLQQGAELIHKAHLDHDEMNSLVTKVNAAQEGGDQAQLAVIARLREEYKGRVRSTAGGRLRLPVNVNRIHHGWRPIHNIDVKELRKQFANLDPELAGALRREIYEMIAKLVSVSEEVKA